MINGRNPSKTNQYVVYYSTNPIGCWVPIVCSSSETCQSLDSHSRSMNLSFYGQFWLRYDMQCGFSGKYFWFQPTTFIPSAGSFQYKAIKITVKHPINAHRRLQAWQDIFNFQQLFMEWKSDHFWLRYNQKREKRLNMGVCVEGEGRLLEGGIYWVFYGRPSAVHTHYLSSKRNWTLPPKTFRNPSKHSGTH